ncbi:MAG: type IV conjugative transfer system protein TraL [Desulfovibrio sp.]|uniref:type IV conjugative transfer system protein TraL n=1 Tax=Desulfovibrio sp. TaxID=885 RepID=UPI00135D3BCF|nr:type IV conjugative transfer system protein TraL [Desulfovibrio sp.]MTJ94327.1 type IV conjugative transfer system protein TraL [Desulfovibrio sp.]
MSKEPVYIPRHIDAPFQFLFWQFDEILPVIVAAMFGVLLHQQLICFAIGLVIMNRWTKYRDNHPDGYALHALYWTGIVPLSLVGKKSHLIPEALDREFLP